MPSLYDNPLFYDELFNPNEHLDFYRSISETYAGPILELACGTGQIIGHLADLPNALYGSDLSEEMIERARSVYGHVATLDLSVKDMTSFHYDVQFDVIFIPRNSLLHLHDIESIQACLSKVSDSLTPHGVFCFDIFNPEPSLLQNDLERRVMFSSVEHPEYGKVDVFARGAYDKANQIVQSDWYIQLEEKSEVSVGRLELRCIFPQELEVLLQASGFKLSARYGSLSKDPFESSSARQVCVCKRL